MADTRVACLSLSSGVENGEGATVKLLGVGGVLYTYIRGEGDEGAGDAMAIL